ncbi:hypothetical protein DN752_06560 [Echinicola strongylocentroti]|uniref:Uncharacterized protein n=1 Tax=Echinicola strongylocentroti TaxID=1795355 RepID=A0A2Z4IQJ5_9BACT|nr:hypothetical protein DN752_06560 [Echinicola strongylocentroti]
MRARNGSAKGGYSYGRTVDETVNTPCMNVIFVMFSVFLVIFY